MTQGWGAATDVQLNEAKASIEAEFEAMRAALQEVALSPLCAADNAGVLRAVLLQAMLMRSNEMQEAANNHFMSAASEVDAQRELIAQVTRGCWIVLMVAADSWCIQEYSTLAAMAAEGERVLELDDAWC